MKAIENACCKRGEHSPPLLRKGEGAASGVGAPSFNPEDWLASWKHAGGGWAGRSLLLPPPYRPRLRAMISKLGADEIKAVAEHLGVDVEVEA